LIFTNVVSTIIEIDLIVQDNNNPYIIDLNKGCNQNLYFDISQFTPNLTLEPLKTSNDKYLF
jgi:hypothetical protein